MGTMLTWSSVGSAARAFGRPAAAAETVSSVSAARRDSPFIDPFLRRSALCRRKQMMDLAGPVRIPGLRMASEFDHRVLRRVAHHRDGRILAALDPVDLLREH